MISTTIQAVICSSRSSTNPTNAAAINMSIEKAAKAFIKGGQVSDGLLNMAEMAFRPYDPCHGCGTHAWPGGGPLAVMIYNRSGELVRKLQR